MLSQQWYNTFYQLIVETSTTLPSDVEAALAASAQQEQDSTNASQILRDINRNVSLASQKQAPLCQDTGTLLFWITAPPGVYQHPVREAIYEAIHKATNQGYLRTNCIDPLTERNAPGNAAPGNPEITWEEDPAVENCRVALVLKGGGSENVSTQYSLPNKELGADRDFEGVRRCALHALWQAQGKGCAPGIASVVVGGDRASGYKKSKELFLRTVGTENTDPLLDQYEEIIEADANQLGIGPMGLGGYTTILDVFMSSLHRVPASYFVTISYMCWAFRRRIIRTTTEGELIDYVI